MGFGQIIAAQIEGAVARADAGLITQEQAKAEVGRYTRGCSETDKAEAAQILGQRLQQHRP